MWRKVEIIVYFFIVLQNTSIRVKRKRGFFLHGDDVIILCTVQTLVYVLPEQVLRIVVSIYNK